jgi:RNA-directed DNA polymerase
MWSPQHYLEKGLARGVEPVLLERAIAQIENVVVTNPNLPSLLTLGHLAQRTGANYFKLRNLLSSSRVYAYRSFRIRKRSGGHRLISVPNPELMRVQRWINVHILSILPTHHCSFAFSPKSSIVLCAARHCGARWLVKLDVSGFFGSISEIQVYRVFRAAGYQPLIAFELARLTTIAPSRSPRYASPIWRVRGGPRAIESYANRDIGFLPQGAPSSPMLSNLIMRDCDSKIEAIAKARGVHYTRYSDDLTFSTRAEFDRDQARGLINDVTRVLRKIGLRPNARKTVVVPPGGRKVVLGLLVDGAKPKLSREFRSLLRQHLYYLTRFGPAAHAKHREFDSIWGMYRHVRGQIDFAKMVDPTFAAALRVQFEKISWPSKFDATS